MEQLSSQWTLLTTGDVGQPLTFIIQCKQSTASQNCTPWKSVLYCPRKFKPGTWVHRRKNTISNQSFSHLSLPHLLFEKYEIATFQATEFHLDHIFQNEYLGNWSVCCYILLVLFLRFMHYSSELQCTNGNGCFFLRKETHHCPLTWLLCKAPFHWT